MGRAAGNRYLEAVTRIPAGETRSFSEVATIAGRPGAARAAGRAVSGCPVSSDVPWHRVVAADGALARDEARAAEQLRRLRREGARPRASESVRAWIRRRRPSFVGHWGRRWFADASDAVVVDWPPSRVEAIRDAATGWSRGFRPAGTPPPEPVPLPEVDPPPAVSSDRLESIRTRLGRVDWDRARRDIDRTGLHTIRALLAPSECEALLATFG